MKTKLFIIYLLMGLLPAYAWEQEVLQKCGAPKAVSAAWGALITWPTIVFASVFGTVPDCPKANPHDQ
jgi:hypothetical protein